MQRRTFIQSLGVSSVLGGSAWALDKYPLKPITWVCPYAAGGNADLGLDDAMKVFGSDFDVREPRVIRATLKVDACIQFAAADEAEIVQQEIE